MILGSNSPLKRKHSEFHDPDYPQEEEITGDDDNGMPGCSSQFANKKLKPEIATKKTLQDDNYFGKVKQIIETEFQREIVIKTQQLEEIDERIEKAKRLLERLRYGIVLKYYKKQEIPLTSADAATLKGNYSLFDRDDKGPQMSIHPSIKKLIGKRPKDFSEVIRTCPKRTAAQNAVQTIRAKSQVQKREEKKLQQIIKQQGIVIDHSKQNLTESDVDTLLNTAAQESLKRLNNSAPSLVKQEKASEEPSNKPSGKSLNAARLNNKLKHLIVVGNTSKYIGNEVERDVKSHTQNLTHKWLVYVQPKDTKQPIEKFIKKVRFHLHRSYRPNDVVDIESPPFQVSRRGWGEFPIRVQLFFHSEFHQKPVQLIHNIILDQTLSGIQTLGAETVLEIWLRDIKLATSSANNETEDIKSELEVMKKPPIPTKPKPNINSRTEELVDDNLLDFLNKIEASRCSISGDIEKIQPTILVNEPLGVKIKPHSPVKCKPSPQKQQKSPTKTTNLQGILNSPEISLANTLNSITSGNNTIIKTQPLVTVTMASQVKTSVVANASLITKPLMTSINLRIPTSPAPIKLINDVTASANQHAQIPPLRLITSVPDNAKSTNATISMTTQKTSKDVKILMPSASVASAVRKTILPIASSNTSKIPSIPYVSQVAMANKTHVAQTTSSTPKQILQKKLVQLVDSTGKVKYIQMLVAASSGSSNVQNVSRPSVAPKLITMAPSLMKSSTVTNTTQITNTVTTPILRTPNGVALMPAMTTKPNIFRIVPESKQTKPQIATFSTTTTGSTFTNTMTTTSNQQQQQLQNLRTTTAQIQRPITTPTHLPVTTKPINLTPMANKLQKSSISNALISTKNLVFQKEGKVYIVDPQQMKYKQQQKNQVSLLKPQISLLKQQQQPKQLTNSAAENVHPIAATSKAANINLPPIHFGLKQQRINSVNSLQLLQLKRMLFEKLFLRQEFTNIRSGVEFLLRRLKLIVPQDSIVADFPYVSHTLQEFSSLTAFKQRACEWLRAKNIARLIRSHKDLQRLNNSSKEIFWSTKEIATFARQYAYTPPIKSLPKPGEQLQMIENNKDFTDLVKSELKQDQSFNYDTLTAHYKVRRWVDANCQTLEEYEYYENQHQIIDVDNIEEEAIKKVKKIQSVFPSYSTHLSGSSLDTYLSPPTHLENQCQLVSDICKDFSIKLDYEELESGIYHPSTQTVLAQSLHLFIEKLLRQTVALKQSQSLESPSVLDLMCTILPQDFAKVLASNRDFDFITNNNFGSALLAENIESPVKQEKS